MPCSWVGTIGGIPLGVVADTAARYILMRWTCRRFISGRSFDNIFIHWEFKDNRFSLDGLGNDWWVLMSIRM